MLSQVQQRSLVILPKVSALPSMLGSLYIVSEFVRGNAKQRKSTYRRLICGLSVLDFLSSTFFFLSTWPVPADSGVYLASGNVRTCNAQGFFIMLTLGVPFYNLSLSVYYYLAACGPSPEGGKTFDTLVGRFEPMLHLIPWTVGLGAAFIGLVCDLYRLADLWCWIGPDHDRFRIYMFYSPALLCIAASIGAMSAIYRAVRNQEKKVERYARNYAGPDAETKRTLSKKVATQAFLYGAAFVFSWTFAALTRFIQYLMSSKRIPYPLLVLFTLTLPGQGFLNFLVYNRGRYVAYWKKHPDGSFCGFVKSFLRRTVCGCCCTLRCRGCSRMKDEPTAEESSMEGDEDGGESSPTDVLRSLYRRGETVASGLDASAVVTVNMVESGHVTAGSAGDSFRLSVSAEDERRRSSEDRWMVDGPSVIKTIPL